METEYCGVGILTYSFSQLGNFERLCLFGKQNRKEARNN